MPVLLLAQGDPKAKDLLRRAIEARYGLVPPAIESLELDLRGRIRTRVGPITTWVPLQIQTRFRFPTAMRWDFIVKPVGVAIQRGVEAFDGTTYRRLRGGGTPTVVEDRSLIESSQRQLWALAAMFLTPLGEHFVRLSLTDELQFEAANTLFNDPVRLCLRPDYSLERVEVTCTNPDSGQVQLFSLRLSAEQTPIDSIMLPNRISAFWDDAPYFEAQPVRVANNTSIDDAVFTLTDGDGQV